MQPANTIVGAVRDAAQPLKGANDDYDALLELIGDARLVLLGEATHGTHEFYRERAQITKRLIAEKGFTAVAVEADWPNAYDVNRYVRGLAWRPGPMLRWPVSSGFRPGCGATPKCSILSAGYAPITTAPAHPR